MPNATLVMSNKSDPVFGEFANLELEKGGRASEMELLMQQMDLLAKMQSAGDAADVTISDSERTIQAYSIKKDPDSQLFFVDQQKEIKQIAKAIAADHSKIHQSGDRINEIWTSLSPLPAVIQQDQAETQLKFEAVEQRNQTMGHQVLVIQHNDEIIQQNLLASAQKVDVIQQKANLIKADHQTMQEQLTQAAEKDKQLQEKVEVLKKNAYGTDIKEIAVIRKLGFWQTLAQKIIEVSISIFSLVATTVLGGGLQFNKWVALFNPPSPSDGLNAPVGVMLFGTVAYPAIRNSVFSIGCIGVSLSLFYYRWRQLPDTALISQ